MDTVKMTVESDIAARKDDNSSITSSNATKLFGAEAAREADELYKRGKKFTVFHNELARQTAAHCPRVARMLVQVWSGMCALLEGAIERYEHQTRLSQQFHSKFLRLVTHSEDKLSRLSRENEELRAEIRELRAELSGKSSAVTALTREIDMWKSEVSKLNRRYADEMNARIHGDKFGGHRSTDVLANAHSDTLEAIESERVKQLDMLEQQSRLIRFAATAMLAGHGAGMSVQRSHTGTQTQDVADDAQRPPPPPVLHQKAGIHIPKEFRKLLSIIPRKTRLFSIRFLRRLVLQMFLEKAVIDHTATEVTGIAPMTPMGVFVCESMMKKYGLPALADAHISSFIQSIRAFYDSDRRSRIFDLFIGGVSAREDDRPVLGNKCQHIVSDALWALIEKKQINPQLVLTGDPDSFVMINRQKAVEALKETFSFVAPSLVDLMLVRIRTLPAARAKSSHMLISLEDFLCVVIESWVGEQFRWQKRIEKLFDHASSAGPAVNELDDASGKPISPKARSRKRHGDRVKPVKMSPITSSGISSTDLPLLADALSHNEDEEATEETKLNSTFFTNIGSHEVVIRPSLDPARNSRRMTLAALRSALTTAMPQLDVAKIDFMFDSARKMLETAAWDRLRKPWASAMDVETGRKFYYNTRTLESRWFMPILERQTVLSLDYCTFCEMCMEHSLLLSTAHETDVLDTATKASILIQKVARGFVSRRRRSVDASVGSHGGDDSASAAPGPAASAPAPRMLRLVSEYSMVQPPHRGHDSQHAIPPLQPPKPMSPDAGQTSARAYAAPALKQPPRRSGAALPKSATRK